MRYIGLLRAINVGGNRLVKMETLRPLLAEAGLTDVRTYIQSGNFVGQTDAETDAETLARRIESVLQQALGFAVPTTLRTPAELQALCAALPACGESQRLNVYFFGGAARAEAASRLEALQQAGLQAWLRPHELILLTERSLDDKRLATANWLEKQFGCWLTARNDRTVRKLLALAG